MRAAAALLEAFRGWVLRRRAYHYDADPWHEFRYECFEWVASLLGEDTIYDSRNQ